MTPPQSSPATAAIAPPVPPPTAPDPAPTLTVKAQLLAAIDLAPDTILVQVLNFLNFLLSTHNSPTQTAGVTIESQELAAAQSQWSPEFLSTFGAWEGELERNQPQWGETEEVEALDIGEFPV